jgi:hypothetical protein
MSNVLENFAQKVSARQNVNLDGGKVGFDWITIVLTIVVPLIQNCLNNRNSLAAFVEGRRGPLQLAALRTRCRQECRRLSGVGFFQAVPLGDKLMSDILAEADLLKREGGLVGGEEEGDIYQKAIDEVNGVLG